jgi:RNA polymerase subunit RPABC4/transcription elongation factor Spt4
MSEIVEVCEKCRIVFLHRPNKCPFCDNTTDLYNFKIVNKKRVLKKIGST